MYDPFDADVPQTAKFSDISVERSSASFGGLDFLAVLGSYEEGWFFLMRENSDHEKPYVVILKKEE